MSLLQALPEELIERILSEAIQSAPALIGRKSAVLLTCRQWYRVAQPLFYASVYIKNETQLCRLVSTLELANDSPIGSLIRSLTLSCSLALPQLHALFYYCTELRCLDICLDSHSFGIQHSPVPRACSLLGPATSPTTETLLASISSLQKITHFTLRKDQNVYLTLPKVGQFINGLADCVRHWNDLQSIYVAFRLSDDTGTAAFLQSGLQNGRQQATAPVSPVRSPLTNLTQALSHSPRLESVTTHLPSVWNSVLAGLVNEDENASEKSSEPVSKSANLKRIVLLPGAGSPKPTAPSYSRPTYHPTSPIIDARIPVAGSVPGHGLGLSLAPAPAPSPAAELKSEKTEPAPPLPINSLYLSTAARHHPRLMDLIREGWKEVFSSGIGAGSYGAGRGRAWTWAAGE